MAVVPGIVGVRLHYNIHVKAKHVLENYPESISTVFIASLNKFRYSAIYAIDSLKILITWFDLNELSPLRIALE